MMMKIKEFALHVEQFTKKKIFVNKKALKIGGLGFKLPVWMPDRFLSVFRLEIKGD